jgi:hypothetical protein
MKPRPISTDVMGAHPMAQEPGAGGVGRAKERVFGGESSWLQILSQKLEAGGDESVSASKAGVGGKLSKKEQFRIAMERGAEGEGGEGGGGGGGHGGGKRRV